MSFVYPNFLWALLLLAIPIIIHLFHFRRYKKILFPNVRFLQNVQKQTQSVKKVRNLLVLLARLAAVAFLVFAFAQPYIPLNKANRGADQIIGMYIDNSFSMENEGSKGPLIEEAKESARDLIKAYPNSDRFLIHTNSSNSVHPISREDAIAFIDEIEIEKTSRKLPDALKTINRGLVNNSVVDKQIYVFSDLQKSQDVDFSDALDTNSSLYIVPLAPNEGSNLSIDSAWFESPVIHLNEPIELKVRLTNHGSHPVTAASVSLDIKGVKKAVSSLTLDPNSSKTVSMGFSISKGGWQNAKLTVEDAPIIFDDTYYLSFNIKSRINILIANGGEQNQYLTALFGKDTYFNVENLETGNIDLPSLKTADLVVLNELETVSSGLVSALGEYVSNGGSVFLIPSSTAQPGYLNNLTQALSIPGYSRINEQPTSVGKIELNHPLFDKVFRKIPDNPDFPKVNKYIRMESAGKSSYVLLSLENQDPYLSTSKLGNGHVFQLASPLNPDWSNFQQHGLFVPIVLKMAMNRSLDYPLSYSIGNSNLFKAVPESRNLQGELQLSNGENKWIPVLSNTTSSPYIDAGYDNLTAGNLEMTYSDSLLQLIAFNYNREESSNSYFNIGDIERFMPMINVNRVENPTTFVKETVTEMRFGKQFWKWCIILALIFLAIEILLLRFWPSEAKQ